MWSEVACTGLTSWSLIKFLDLESGRLFEAGRLLHFHHFQHSHRLSDNEFRDCKPVKKIINTLNVHFSSLGVLIRGWAK